MTVYTRKFFDFIEYIYFIILLSFLMTPCTIRFKVHPFQHKLRGIMIKSIGVPIIKTMAPETICDTCNFKLLKMGILVTACTISRLVLKCLHQCRIFSLIYMASCAVNCGMSALQFKCRLIMVK